MCPVNFVALTLLFGLLQEPTESHRTVFVCEWFALYNVIRFLVISVCCGFSIIVQTLPVKLRHTTSNSNVSFVIHEVIPCSCFIVMSQQEVHMHSDKIKNSVHLPHSPYIHNSIQGKPIANGNLFLATTQKLFFVFQQNLFANELRKYAG